MIEKHQILGFSRRVSRSMMNAKTNSTELSCLARFSGEDAVNDAERVNDLSAANSVGLRSADPVASDA